VGGRLSVFLAIKPEGRGGDSVADGSGTFWRALVHWRPVYAVAVLYLKYLFVRPLIPYWYDMQMRHLECFLAVAEELHFTRAAQRLHLSQPPLSRHVRELEEELGVALFRRTRRNVTLTNAGKAYQQRVHSILSQLAQAREEAVRIHRGEVGTLTIGFVGALTYEFLPGLLRRYRARMPNVHLSLRDMVPAEQIEALATGRIDVGFAGILPDDCAPEIAHRVLRRERMAAALPDGHILAKRKTIPLEALAEEPWVVMERKISPTYDRFIRRLCAQAGFSPRVEHEAARAQAMLGLVAIGLGVTIVPETIARLPSPGVVFRPLKQRLIYEHAVIWRAGTVSSLASAFLDSLSASACR
jgi:DNA-binding transcriptional LysR family regulator